MNVLVAILAGWRFIASPVGRWVAGALIALSAYGYLQHRIESRVTKDVQMKIIEQDKKTTTKKLNKTNAAQNHLDRRLVRKPSSLRDENDGHRRD